jgi:hypothetical protein
MAALTKSSYESVPERKDRPLLLRSAAVKRASRPGSWQAWHAKLASVRISAITYRARLERWLQYGSTRRGGQPRTPFRQNRRYPGYLEARRKRQAATLGDTDGAGPGDPDGDRAVRCPSSYSTGPKSLSVVDACSGENWPAAPRRYGRNSRVQYAAKPSFDISASAAT